MNHKCIDQYPAARELFAQSESRAAEIEELRRLPDDLAASLVEAGLVRLWVAKDYGGPQEHICRGLDLITDAAYHDGSVGWFVMIANTTALLSGRLPVDAAELIYGDPQAVTGGLAAPAAVATVVEGGLSVTGRWNYGSGIHHCTWIGGGVRVVDEAGKPHTTRDGAATPFVFFPAEDVTVLDTWHVHGLRGSGSTDYEVDHRFVPEGRWVNVDRQQGVIDDPLYRFSTYGALASGIAAVALGLGRRALDELIKLGSKRPAGSSRSLSERPAVQADVARAEATLLAADSWFRHTIEEAWAELQTRPALSGELRRRVRLAANHAVTSAAATVDACYTAAGGTAIYLSSPLQRVFRDIHVATQHAMIAPRVYEPLGRMAFGLETDMTKI